MSDTRRAEESRSAGSTDAGYTNPSRNNATRHEEANRTEAPRESAALQQHTYEQERPAAAEDEDVSSSDSRRYQADSYESSGQRQAEPQASVYSRAEEPVSEQKETYPRADAPRRDADRTAGSTETNRADVFRREEQPGRTPVTPGYAADVRHEEANRTEAPRESAALQQHTYEQERPTVAEDANRSDSRRYQADSYESSGQRQAAEAYAKNAQEQASNAFQTRAPKGEPSNNRVKAPQAVPGSQNAKDHIGHATKQGTGTGIAATVIAATSATSAAATEIEATVRAVQNATGNPSITNRQIADSYARTGQMDAVTAAMAAKQSASSYHRTEQQAYVNTARQTFGYVGKSPKLEGQKPDGAQTVDIGVYGVRNGNIISIKTDGASNAAKKYTIRSDGTIQINGTVANVYDTGNEKVFVGWRGATVQQDSVIAPNGQRYKLGADKTVVSATGTIFKTVKDVEATARQGQGIAVSMASIFHETGAKAADFSDSGAGFSTKDFAKVITPKSTQALMKKGVFGKAILKQQRMFSVVLQTEVMAHATRSMKVLGSARTMVDHYDSILASISNNTAHMLKMNAFLENKYLVQAADLAGFEQKLTNKLAQFKLSTDVKELKALIASKSLSGEKLDAAKQFLALQQEKQIRGILAGKMKATRQTLTAQGFSLNPEDLKKALADRSISAADYKTISSYLRLQKKARFIIVNNGMLSTDKLNLSHLEQAFLSASMPFSAKEAGLPSNIKAIKKLLKKDKKTNTLTKQQKKLAKAMLRLNRSLKLVNFSQAVALGLVGSAFKSVKSITKKGIRTVKDITNRYLSQDYTMRGLLLLTGLGSGIVKHTKRAYKVGKTSLRTAKMVPKAVVSTARATKAVTKAGVHAIRAGRSIAKNGIRATAKEGVKRITGFATRKFKKLGKGTVKAAGTTMLKAVARILMLIATTLLSVLGPFLLAIIVLCLIVFSVMAFVSSSGDDVYYDAGDEDTELAMQEMVDLLTLCHSSFRAALSDQSGVNAGAEQQQWIQTLESWADEMVKVGAIYENTKNKTPYTEALKQSPVRTNCALLVTHALQKAGIFNKNDKFYGSKDGTLKGSGVEHLRQIANITHYQNGTTRVSDLDLQPGDIVTYYIQHTNVYIGTNGSGQKEWIDAGRGTTINGTNGSKWRSFKTTHTCTAYVSNLIRLNFATSASNSSGGSAKQMKKGDTSKVQGLYDVTQGTWWNYEFTYQYIHGRWAAGTKQRQLDQMFDNGRLTISGNGNYAFVNNKMYMAAFGSYWGETGDVLKVEFNKAIKIGSQPATKILYIIKCDAKAWQHTGYPAEPEGIYGHHLGGHRDFAEFMGYGSQPAGLNGKGIVPVSCTNMGSILDGTFNENLIGTSSLISSSVKSDADIFYRQEIDQQTYRDIINRENNIYYTFPVDQEVPDGITPTPTPKGYDPKTDTGEVYAFYNNNQELISMVNAMFDFDINTATSVKQTIIATQNKSGSDEAAADSAMQRGVTNKINDDTWKLIGFLQQNGMDLTKYKSGGYDDLKYSTLVGLFNASHIITTTDVKQYHKGPDGTINAIKKNGRIVGQNNKDGRAYQVPVIETTYDVIELEDGSHTSVPNTHIKLDANGNIVYQTLYEPCPGHTKQSVAVITLHFDSLLDIQKWWEDNIYSVDDFDKENPDYSSEKKSDPNYRAKSTVLKQSIQIIKKPDFYKALKGTCDEGTASDSNFSPGTMTESQQEVAKACYKYMTKTMNLSNAQAVGVLVNILRESGFRYTAVEEGNGGEGYGLCQWSYGRRTRLVEWCNAHPSDGAYNTLEGQLSFLNAEFTVYPDVWSGDGAGGFRRCQTEREAGEYFLRYFERPNSDNIAQRSNEMESDIATVKKYLRK